MQANIRSRPWGKGIATQKTDNTGRGLAMQTGRSLLAVRYNLKQRDFGGVAALCGRVGRRSLLIGSGLVGQSAAGGLRHFLCDYPDCDESVVDKNRLNSYIGDTKGVARFAVAVGS